MHGFILAFLLSAPLVLAGLKDCDQPLTFDFQRQWGVQLLPDDDPAFTDPEYIKALIHYAGVQTVSFYSRHHPYYTPGSDLFVRYQLLLQQTIERESVHVLRFSNTGTEANNFLYDFAARAFTLRTGQTAARPNLIYLGRPYGGTFGRIAQISRLYEGEYDYRERFHVAAPWTSTFKGQGPAETKHLRQLEGEALAQIRQKVADPQNEIGGIFLEPIAFDEGVRVYRPIFLKRLRKLADELRVPIFADEVLTGGGRTGKFWAFQNYPGFKPDLLTFGKGMVAHGVLEIERYEDGLPRWRWPKFRMWSFLSKTHPERQFENTSRLHPLVLLQGIQVLQRILTDRLDEQARDVGAFALEQFRAKARRVGHDASQISGVGLLIYVGPENFPVELLGDTKIKSYHGRWMPPLTTTRDDIRRIFK